MKVKTLDNFLGCCDLEVGAKIIGFVAIISAICNIISGLLGGYSDFENEVQDYVQPRFISNMAICMGIIYFLLASLLLIGIYKKRPSFLLPWLIVDGISLGSFIIITIGCVFIFIFKGFVTVGFTFLILFAAVFGIGLYLWFCIYSLYVKLKTNN